MSTERSRDPVAPRPTRPRRPPALPGGSRLRRPRRPAASRAHAAHPGRPGVDRARARGKALAARRGTRRSRPHRLGDRPGRRRPLARARPVVGRRPRWLHPRRGLPPHRRLRMARERHPGRRGRGDAHVRRPSGPGPGPRRAVPGRPHQARPGGGRPDPSAGSPRRPRPRGSRRSPPASRPANPRTGSARSARVQPGVQRIEWTGWRGAVRTELDALESGRLGPWLPWAGTPRPAPWPPPNSSRAYRSRPGACTAEARGWLTAGSLLIAHGAVGLLYDLAHPRD